MIKYRKGCMVICIALVLALPVTACGSSGENTQTAAENKGGNTDGRFAEVY